MMNFLSSWTREEEDVLALEELERASSLCPVPR
jgi:hypothetical protein